MGAAFLCRWLSDGIPYCIYMNIYREYALTYTEKLGIIDITAHTLDYWYTNNKKSPARTEMYTGRLENIWQKKRR